MKMNQVTRFPSSSVCYYFSFRHRDKSFICSRCLGPHKFWAIDQLSYSVDQSPLLKHSPKTRKNTGPIGKRLKETELLKVTNKQATQKTMTVGKLNASLVTAFAKEPGMILNNAKGSRYGKGITQEGKFSGSFQKKQDCTNVRSRSNFKDMNTSALNTKERCSKVIEDSHEAYNFVGISNHEARYGGWYEREVEKTNSSAMSINNPSQLTENYVYPCDNSNFKSLNEQQDSIRAEELETEQSFSRVTEDTSVSYLPSDLHVLFHVKNSSFDDTDNNNQLFLSFIDVCVNNGMLDSAYELLCRHKVKNVNNSSIYDTVLKGYSEKGEWAQVQKVLSLIAQHKIQPSCATFALSLDCLYRITENQNYKKQKAKEMLTMFQSTGYRIDDLFHYTGANYYERENILKIVRWFFPNFKPSPPKFSIQNRSRLLADLYGKDYVPTSPLPNFTTEAMTKAVEDQLIVETESFCEVESIVKRGICSPEHKACWSDLIELWKNNLHINFLRYYNALKEEVKTKSHLPNLYPFLTCFPAEEYVNLMLHEINRLCLTSDGFTMNTSTIYRSIGNRIWHRYCVRKKVKNNKLMGKYKDFINKYSSWYLNPGDPNESARQKWLMMMWDNPDIMRMEERDVLWPDGVKIKIGKFVFDIILKSTMIPPRLLPSKSEKKEIPAFYLVLRSQKGILSEQLKFHPYVGMLYRRAHLNTLFFGSDQLPMFCPPKPWTSVDNGGFYILPSALLRPTQFNYNMRMLRSVCPRNLYVIFDSLNQLQSIPWVVNEDVLNIALQVFKEGGSEELNVPMYPDVSPIPEPQDCLDSKSRATAYRERLKIIQKRQDDFGLWCEGLYKLSLANHLRKKIFWLPHNMDFRGRVYPIAPHISHITSDLYRSLFLFAKKERLGQKGLDWLKIHAINLTGTFSKRPLSDRLNHANEVLDDILDSAERPLDGRMWWAKSEEPWQTLAVCFEIWNALNSRDPANYATGFPVHQDGSCNGLQHYAALGRDSIGAASVNLKPDRRPQDVYNVVANILEEIRKKDAQEGNEIAAVLEGFVTRKIVKQTVMTTVYGVTLYGAKLQIINRLEENPKFPQERVNEAARYLATKVFEALKEMFTSAKEIQDWFLKCANIITGECESTVSWVTPLGLPVAQPYFKNLNNSREVLTKLLPDKRKQKNAFPPNFIHSLDSCHMMLTALYCGRAGLCFASVHDCFWTHPSTVDIMNTICREQFVALHSEEILSDLADHFLKTYQHPKPGTVHKALMEVPKRGNFDLSSVLESVYFFS